jgi:hypothetical protein
MPGLMRGYDLGLAGADHEPHLIACTVEVEHRAGPRVRHPASDDA